MFIFLLLGSVYAYYKAEYSLVISSEDFSLLVDSGIVTKDKAEEIWQTLLTHAEMTNPSKYSASGFEKSSEITLFGLFPLMSLIMTLGSSALLIALYWVMGMAHDSQSRYKIMAISGVCSFVSITMSYSLYEAYGLVVVTWIQMMAGLNFLYYFLENAMVIAKVLENTHGVMEFSKEEVGIVAVLSFVGYYYSLFVAFPMFQLPFFIGSLYLLYYLAEFLEGQISAKFQPVKWIIFTGYSVLMILYMAIAKQHSFLLFSGFVFIDFRFIGFIISSIVFTISVPMLTYIKYCQEFNYPQDNIPALLTQFSNFKPSEDWLPYHKYVLIDFSAFGLFFVFGLVLLKIPMIIAGYIGLMVLTNFLPVNRYSNLIYQLLILSPIIVASILGHVSDSDSLQFTAFYPRSYILSGVYVIIRVALVIISVINAKKYRGTHFKIYVTSDIVVDFILSYIRTIALIVLSENESNFVMSWLFTIGLALNMDPTLKIDSASYADDILKSFCLLFYGIRLSLISYNLTIAFYTGIFLIFLGNYRSRLNYRRSPFFKFAFFLYFWILLQFDCCMNSWVLLSLTFIVTSLAYEIKDPKDLSFSNAILFLLISFILYFLTSLENVCFFTLHSSMLCDSFLNPSSYFPEKELILSAIRLVKSDLVS